MTPRSELPIGTASPLGELFSDDYAKLWPSSGRAGTFRMMSEPSDTRKKLEPFHWVRAFTSDDDCVVTIDFVGGPEYDPMDHCTVRYETETTETEQHVTVLVEGWSPTPPTWSSLPGVCESLGHPRSVTVTLIEPLGARPLINAATGEAHPVNVEPWTPPLPSI